MSKKHDFDDDIDYDEFDEDTFSEDDEVKLLEELLDEMNGRYKDLSTQLKDLKYQIRNLHTTVQYLTEENKELRNLINATNNTRDLEERIRILEEGSAVNLLDKVG